MKPDTHYWIFPRYYNIHWNLYTAETFATFPSQRLLCNVIKFHVVKETKEAVPYFVQDF